MADRSFLARLRASGGPSHDLLVLLDQHRVMTSRQLARATGAPERTVRYRIERLYEANLVDCARPGRERGWRHGTGGCVPPVPGWSPGPPPRTPAIAETLERAKAARPADRGE